MLIKSKRDSLVLNFCLFIIFSNLIFLSFLPAFSSYFVNASDNYVKEDLNLYEVAYLLYKDEHPTSQFNIEEFNTFLPENLKFFDGKSLKKSPYGTSYYLIVNNDQSINISIEGASKYPEYFERK